jgi:hypothetical protein
MSSKTEATKEDRESRAVNWRYYHHSWTYWVALAVFFLALLIYLLTSDLRIFPNVQPGLQSGR